MSDDNTGSIKSTQPDSEAIIKGAEFVDRVPNVTPQMIVDNSPASEPAPSEEASE
jgi:hypothetical protein